MTVVAVLSSMAFLAPAALPDPVETLRASFSAAENDAASAAKEAAEALAARDQGEAELARRKSDLANGGGWLAERAVRRQSAAVRDLVERSIETGARMRVANEAVESARVRLRAALFEEASRRTKEADAAAREGRSEDATAGYGRAVAALSEAARIAPRAPVSLWQGLDAELPLTGRETAADLDAIAAAYRNVVDRIDHILGTLAPQLAALSDGAAAWERLSRFRSVVDRAGPSVDPRPALAAMRADVRRGEELRAHAVARAEHVEALRARVDAGGLQP